MKINVKSMKHTATEEVQEKTTKAEDELTETMASVRIEDDQPESEI